jgi:type IV pilus assembly protein PilB
MLVGEIRDSETAELAIRASITGHLVLSTLHTNDAVGTIARLGDLGVPPYLIGSGLLTIIAQRLIRHLCPYCKISKEVLNEDLLRYGVHPTIIQANPTHQIFDAVGCEQCHNTGYSGRIAIIEILEVTEKIESLIVVGATSQSILKTAREEGMLSMRDDGHIKVLQGSSTFSEVNRVVL